MIINNSKEEIEKIPGSSGLYYFYDENDKILYVGKAKKLKYRLREHLKNYHFHREGMFYRRIIKSKGYRSDKEFPEELKEATMDFQFRGLWKLEPLVIDLIFGNVKKIKIEQISSDEIKQKEKERIQELQPPFNYETASDEYFQVRDDWD